MGRVRICIKATSRVGPVQAWCGYARRHGRACPHLEAWIEAGLEAGIKAGLEAGVRVAWGADRVWARARCLAGA